jgi:hypothetical protein
LKGGEGEQFKKASVFPRQTLWGTWSDLFDIKKTKVSPSLICSTSRGKRGSIMFNLVWLI